jgi:hypothetical protein
MELLMAISTGVGISLATGVRTFLPPLAVGALARADAGIDFSGTSYSFLESVPWLAALVLLIALLTLAQRARIAIPAAAIAIVAAGIGALEFAGAMADEGYAAGVGLAAGPFCAVLGFVAGAVFFGRAAARARSGGEEEAASLVELFAQGAALLLAVLAVLIWPVSWPALLFAIWLIAVQRRRSAQKYEGLRILR